MAKSCPPGKVWAGSDYGCQNPETVWRKQSPGSKPGEKRSLPGLGTKVWTGSDFGWQTQATIDSKKPKGRTPSSTPSRPSAPPVTPSAPSRPSRTPATTTQRPSAPRTPAPKPVLQTGDKAKDISVWAKANPRLAKAQELRKSGASRAEINNALYDKGTAAYGAAGKSEMEKQSDELRSMRKASQERQAAQSGPMYSSPDVKSKMSTRTKRLLGVSEQYDAYDIVLDYLFSEGHVESLEEALYVMMEMSSETIQDIVEGDPSFQIKKSSGAGALTPDAAKQLGPKAVELQKKKAAEVDLPSIKQSPSSMVRGV